MPDSSEERIKTPEQLDNYVRVTSPSAWLVLSAIIIALSGFAFWILTGEIETDKHEIIRPISFFLR